MHPFRLKKYIHSIGIILIILLSGCVDHDINSPVEHVLIAYFGGDNNLANEVEMRINALKDIPLNKNSRLAIFSDTRNNKSKLMEVGNDTILLLHEYENINSADATAFHNILSEVADLYPNAHYGLLLFSHASGWMPEGSYNNSSLRVSGFETKNEIKNNVPQRSIIHDNSSEMELLDFAAAIPDTFFDYIIFEACHMAGIEVAISLKNKTKYMLASSAELVEPGFMPVYKQGIPALLKPEPDLMGFCKKVEADYNNRSNDYASLTLSLIDTQDIELIGRFIKEQGMPIRTEGVQSFDRRNKKLFFDLLDSYSYLPENDLSVLETAIRQCVKYTSSSDEFMPNYEGFTINSHCGLSIYIPQEGYSRLNETYNYIYY